VSEFRAFGSAAVARLAAYEAIRRRHGGLSLPAAAADLEQADAEFLRAIPRWSAHLPVER
jgi:hypothetical protein